MHTPDKRVKESWDCVSAEVVNKSFWVCGIYIKVDGLEDEEIHCLKDSGVAALAASAMATRELLVETDSSKDQFQLWCEENDEELETSKPVVDSKS